MGLRRKIPTSSMLFSYLISLLTLLVGMLVFSVIKQYTIQASLNIIVFFVASFILVKTSGIEEYSGAVGRYIFLVGIVVLINIILGRVLIYRDYINHGGVISNHYEHNIMFQQMKMVAERLRSGSSFNESIHDIQFGQYYFIFIYTSLMFVFGGVNVLNMSIWAGYHIILGSVFCAYIAKKSTKDNEIVRKAFILTLLQPLFLSLNTYNKVIVGEAVILAAVYLYVCSFDSPLLNIALLPIYGFLMYVVRMQYLIIAIIMCCIALICNKRFHLGIRILISIVILFIGVYAYYKFEIYSFVWQELNYGVYLGDSVFNLKTILSRIIMSFLPYFPFTYLFSDVVWYSQIFGVFQIPMNIVLWFYLVFSIIHYRFEMSYLSRVVVFLSFLFFFAGWVSAIHISYLTVGSPLIVVGISKNYKLFLIGKRYLAVLLFLVVLSILYSIIGMAGLGFLSF